MEPPPPPLQLLSLSSSSSSSPSSSSPSPSPSSSSLSSSSSSVSSSQLLPFACRLCSLSFAKSHSLAEHVMCRHSTTKEEEEEENEDKDSSSLSSPPPSSSSSASTSSAAAAASNSSPSSSSPVSSSSAKRSFKCARCEVVAATKSDLHRHENDSHRLQQTERFLWAMYSEQQSQQSTNNNSRVMPDDNVEGGEEFVEELLTEEKSPNRVLDPFLLSTAYRCSLCGQAFTYRCRWHLVHRDELPNDDDADDDNSLKVNKKGPAETTQLPFPCFFCIKKIFEAKKRRAAEIKRQQQLRNSKTNSEQPANLTVIELDDEEEMEVGGDNESISSEKPPGQTSDEAPKGDNNKKDDNQKVSVPNRTSTPPLTITAKLTYKCAGCRLRFTSREDRADHEAAEGHRPSKFACSICGRVLRDRYKLDRHRATVHADLPQHLLQMSFGDSKSANSEHLGPIRTPSAVGAFQCPLCRKRLSRKDHLKEHLRKRHSWRGAISNSAISLAAAKAAERKTVQEESKEDQNSETNHHVHLRLEIEANGFISSSTNKFSSSASSSSSSSSSSGVSSGNSSCNCSPTIIY